MQTFSLVIISCGPVLVHKKEEFCKFHKVLGALDTLLFGLAGPVFVRKWFYTA